MRTINTAIEIAASPETVWDILTDFDAYGDWNPFIVKIQGGRAVGDGIRAELLLPGRSKAMTIKPRVTEVDRNRMFQWLGSMGIKGLFDGRHSFRLTATESGARFEQFEQFTGIFVAPLLMMVGAKTEQGFEAMNRALKERAEAVGS